MAKRIFTAIFSAVLCLFLSGCSFLSFDAKSLMSPPKVNEDQQAIHTLLQGDMTDISFVYPQNGDYRSAIIMEDFTGDGVQDAIGFYSLDGGGGVEVQFLIKDDGVWHSVATFSNSALQVDRVCFSKLSEGDALGVLIGWGSTSGSTGRTASVSAYIFDSNGVMKEYPLGYYSEMALTDFNLDGVEEIFTVDKSIPAETEESELTPATAKIYAFTGDAMETVAETAADNSIASYASAVFSELNYSLSGVVLDGFKADGSMTTQIFYMNENELVNAPSGVNSEEYVNRFTRPAAVALTSRDIDGDGKIEIPRVSLLPGVSDSESANSTGYLVEWQEFSLSMTGKTKVTSLLNVADNYWFTLPAGLSGRITATYDADNRTTTYFSVSSNGDEAQELLGSTLFSVRAFTASSWKSRGEGTGYELLLSQSDAVYGIQIYTQDEQTEKYIERIRQSFKLLGE